MEQLLLVTGAAIYGILGSIHLLSTFFTNKFDPRDIAVKEAMKGTSPVISKDTSMWRAWIGFNASHSFGAMLVAAVYIPLTISYFEVIQKSLWFSLLPILIGLSYLIVAGKYWFKTPFIGVLISTVCFAGAAMLINT